MKIESIARGSLIFLWLFTAATSFWWDRSSGHSLLSSLNITTKFEDWLINLGSFCDLVIGLWLVSGKYLLWNYRIQMALILVYSLLIAVIAPQLWLHPFGPVTKNIPLLVFIYWLHSKEIEL